MKSILEFLSKLASFTGGLMIIALIIMWFGAVPLVAFIFGSISYGVFLALSILMVVLVILVGALMIK